MTNRKPLVLVWVATIILLMNGHSPAQNATTPVDGSGTPGTVPLWTGSGNTLTNSAIKDNGGNVVVALPFFVRDGSGDAAVIASGGIGVHGQGKSVGVLGQGDTAVQAHGTTYGVYASGGTALWGLGTGNGSVGVYGKGDNRGGVGQASTIDGWGVTGENDTGGPAVKAIQHSLLNGQYSGDAVDAFSDLDGMGAWGPAIGIRGISRTIGVLGQILDPDITVTSLFVPDPASYRGDLIAGVVGNCIEKTGGCVGIYGYANVPNGPFAHGIVGETDYGPDGAGVIGITFHWPRRPWRNG